MGDESNHSITWSSLIGFDEFLLLQNSCHVLIESWWRFFSPTATPLHNVRLLPNDNDRLMPLTYFWLRTPSAALWGRWMSIRSWGLLITTTHSAPMTSIEKAGNLANRSIEFLCLSFTSPPAGGLKISFKINFGYFPVAGYRHDFGFFILFASTNDRKEPQKSEMAIWFGRGGCSLPNWVYGF